MALAANVIAVPRIDERGGNTFHCDYLKIRPDSILFQNKTYPYCWTCDRKYIEELGCLWCNDKNYGRNC